METGQTLWISQPGQQLCASQRAQTQTHTHTDTVHTALLLPCIFGHPPSPPRSSPRF